MQKPKDITAIEIKESDEIYNDIKFLNYDFNYNQYGYEMYNEADVFSIEHPLGGDAVVASGKIFDICGFEFNHCIPTDHGASGCPIILLNNNLNLLLVIGIHKNSDGKNINGGIFIGELINEINKDLISKKCTKPIINNLKPIIKKSDNYIVAEIYINDEDINKNVRIINSYEEFLRSINYYKYEENLKNEEKIKECDIYINDELVPFNYHYIFRNKGQYIIQYKFKYDLINTNHMFHGCDLINYMDLSKLNSEKIIDMSCMFFKCDSLISLNFHNFNSKNVINMSGMFWECYSLTNIYFSNFISINVSDMNGMFYRCYSLVNLNLSNFKTRDVTDMSYMFWECRSIINLDLSSFDTQNVTNMSCMFCDCESLVNLNLSNFKTEKVTDMSYMFYKCKALKYLNLANFDIGNVIDLSDIFGECISLFYLYLSKANILNITNKSGIFDECLSLREENIITIGYEIKEYF